MRSTSRNYTMETFLACNMLVEHIMMFNSFRLKHHLLFKRYHLH